MESLLKLITQFKKNKSAVEAGGFSFVVWIIITLIIGGLILWILARSMGRFI